MDNSEHDHGPSDGLVKRNVFVERNELIERRLTKQRDEIAADGQQDKDNIGV